ncbi:MAG: hypothetical protein R2828_12550 [Saprospiraceae bacterium]
MTPIPSTNAAKLHALTKLGGYTAICGATLMIIGAGLMGSTGTDLWVALDQNDLAPYLTAIGKNKPILIANLSFWIAGVLVIGMAESILTTLSTQRPGFALAAKACFRTAVPLAIVAFLAMLSVLVQIAPDTSETAISIAKVVGWIGVRADDIATALIVGAAPLFISMAGRGNWMPNWLTNWGYLAGIIGLFSILVLFITSLAPFGIIIVPVGLGWLIATGIVLLRRKQEEA